MKKSIYLWWWKMFDELKKQKCMEKVKVPFKSMLKKQLIFIDDYKLIDSEIEEHVKWICERTYHWKDAWESIDISDVRLLACESTLSKIRHYSTRNSVHYQKSYSSYSNEREYVDFVAKLHFETDNDLKESTFLLVYETEKGTYEAHKNERGIQKIYSAKTYLDKCAHRKAKSVKSIYTTEYISNVTACKSALITEHWIEGGIVMYANFASAIEQEFESEWKAGHSFHKRRFYLSYKGYNHTYEGKDNNAGTGFEFAGANILCFGNEKDKLILINEATDIIFDECTDCREAMRKVIETAGLGEKIKNLPENKDFILLFNDGFFATMPHQEGYLGTKIRCTKNEIWLYGSGTANSISKWEKPQRLNDYRFGRTYSLDPRCVFEAVNRGDWKLVEPCENTVCREGVKKLIEKAGFGEKLEKLPADRDFSLIFNEPFCTQPFVTHYGFYATKILCTASDIWVYGKYRNETSEYRPRKLSDFFNGQDISHFDTDTIYDAIKKGDWRLIVAGRNSDLENVHTAVATARTLKNAADL